MNDITNNECEAIGSTLTTSDLAASSDITPKKIVGIYGLQNKLKPDKWNVGQSWDIHSRWRKEYKNVKCKNQPKIHNALLKYGYDGFYKVILEELTDPTQQLLDERESYWIKFYNSIENGYNIREAGSRGRQSEETKLKMSISRRGAGNAMYGKTHSDETRKKISLSKQNMSVETRLKMSIAKKGKSIPEEQRKKMALSRVGLTRSPEAIAKTALANTGKTRTVECKLKMSIAMTGKKRKTRTAEHSRNISIGLRKRYGSTVPL